MTPPVTLEPVASHDGALRRALAAASLPLDDLNDAGREFFRAMSGKTTIGFCGLECYGHDALIRSIVVLPEMRGAGRGRALTESLIARVGESGVRTVYLLTVDAAAFFERLGFRTLDRRTAPEAIRQTRQAVSICGSASLMSRQVVGS